MSRLEGLDFRILLNCRLVMIILDALVIESCDMKQFTAICQSCQSLKNMLVVEGSLECLGMRRQTMKLRQTPFCILYRAEWPLNTLFNVHRIPYQQENC